MVKNYVNEERVLSTSLCPPAVRMVVIEATAWGGDDDKDGIRSSHTVHPVIALRCKVIRRYRKPITGPSECHEDCGSDQELLDQGWQLVDQSERFGGVFQCAWNGELFAHDEPFFREPHSPVLCLHVCHWLPEEDGKRLREHIRDARQQATERQRSTRKGTAAVSN